MSVECGLFVVDWDVLTVALDDGKSPGEMVDEWTERLVPIAAAQAQDEFLAALERMEGALPPSRLEPLNRLFSSLFWSWKDPILRILDAGGPDDGIESLWSPDTVQRFAGDVDQGDGKDIARAFDDRVGKSHYFDGCEEFVSYLESWCSAIRDAASEGKAVVVYVWG